ncbi:MAG: HAMP domain-containing sensor histidine kinase [Archangium sp.]|nr:HAMP domain-containing sensor histidine kinase [Archangium sp.]MDP3152278.1 HAMP domain-containing sensor histidine kinase [Archangium sp.]
MTIAIGGAAILLFGTEGLVDLRDEEQGLKVVASRETQLLARSLQRAFRDALRDQQIEHVAATLAALAAVEPTVAIFVYDEERKVVATSKGAQPSRATERLAERGSTSPTAIVEFDPEEAPTRLRLAIRLREETVGHSSAIVLERPLNELHRDLAASRRYIVTTTAIFVLAVAGLTWFLTQRSVGRPLEALVAQMHKLSGASSSPPPGNLDEVAETRAEFDRLVVALSAARTRMAEEIEARRGLERGLERADKLITLGQLSAVMAHEIGSPLQILEGRARSLHKSAADPDATRRVADMLVEQTERITRIVGQMLSITRRRAPVRTPLDAEAVVKRVLSLLELEAERRGVRLVLESSGAGTVSADSDQLQQVVLNLVRNALEASPRDTKVTVTLTGTPQQLKLTVADQGPGVPTEARDQLFEPFFTTKPDGSGLGLSVVRSLVREHQGEVALVEVPSGCTIAVTLPRAAEAGAA